MILLWILLILFFGGLLAWLSEWFDSRLPRWIALFSVAATLIPLVLLYQGYDADSESKWNDLVVTDLQKISHDSCVITLGIEKDKKTILKLSLISHASWNTLYKY